ncbi:MAG: zinc ribbon domain-containing protein [Thermodesulfovibrionales bacterium]
MFAKYLSIQKHASDISPIIPHPRSSGEAYDKSNRLRAYLGNLFFYADPEINIIYLTGRAFVLLVIIVWSLKFIFSSVESNYSGSSFMHLINLPFHEAGHVIFRIFGQFILTLGGSLTQCLVPTICLLTFLVKTRDPFAASISLWWLGENLIDLAPYINDARALKLMLLGGVSGQDVDDYHDWEFILRKLGSLEYDHLLAKIAHSIGALMMICALVWGAVVLLTQYKNRRSD